MIKFLAGLVACFVVLCAGYAIASRNSSGTMSPANGPYVAGTVINPTTINSRYSDIENEITDSLSRSGKGGMTAPLKLPDGTNAAPSLTFTSDADTGFYRIGANDLGLTVGGAKTHEWTAAGEVVTGNLGIGGAAADPFDVTVSGSASGTVSTWLQASLADGNNNAFYVGKALGAGQAGILTYTKNATAANSTWCMGVFGGAANTLCVDGNNKAYSNGSLTIGASGTAISGSFAASSGWTPGSIGAGSSAGTTITVTGAAAGAPCTVGSPVPNTGVYLWCWVAPANSCNLQLVNPTAAPVTGTTGTYSCRVFNP